MKRAFTLVEILIVLAVIALLIGISFPLYANFKRKADEVDCQAKMRKIYFSLDSAVKDQGMRWPQAPDSPKEEKLWKWWTLYLLDFGVAEEDWHCNTNIREVEAHYASIGEEMPEYYCSYIPTNFDDRPNTAYRWRMPWLIERGDFHGKGPHMIMPDGSLQYAPFKKFDPSLLEQ